MHNYACVMHILSYLRVGVVGGSGYAGLELLRLLARHPGTRVAFATSRSAPGAPTPLPGLAFTPGEDADPSAVDVLFLSLPHGEAVPWVEALRGSTVRVVDLTADHRPGSGRDAGVLYGLPEVEGPRLAGARLVANPGCYATGVVLALLPLLQAGLLDLSRTVVVNAASGVTGAGRSPRTDLLFAEVAGDYRAYGLGNGHRHLLEMRAALPGVDLLFTPHLLPVPRGILETMAVPVAPGADAAAVRYAWNVAYGTGDGPVRVHPVAPALADVVGSDLLLLGASDNAGLAAPVVSVVAALDNLGKGAAGQAVQNMNLMAGLEPWAGMRC